jgi:hypothetical protein
MASEVRALTAKQHELLTFFQQEWLLHGAVPSRDKCVSAGVCEPQFYTSCVNSPSFRTAMDVRGISTKSIVSDGPAASALTERQLICANTMLDLRDNRSQKKKLTELGIPTQTYEAWLRDPAYQSYIRTRSELMLPDNQHESHLALLDRVRSGDVNAIKYFNEITGRFTPASAQPQINVGEMLMSVLEILQRHIKDPEVLSGVGEDLMALGAGLSNNSRQVAGPVRPPRVIEQIPGF